METTGARPEDLDPAQQLRELERAEALPYVVYPKTPGWYMPAMGLVLAGFVGAFSLAGKPVFPLVIALVVVFEALVLGLVKSRYGAFPSPGPSAPPEIRSAYKRCIVGLAIVAVVVALVWWGAGPLVAAAVTFGLVTAGLAIYESHYAGMAALARERLGIQDGDAA
ncbi:hypothetical protein [Xylanimonas protaetiae]|uniref:hypothetical protein n=1 Tax=Xylanimonas protaetiae TaxID=2509457 RepID=UPI001F5C52CF|nr:hypothetical protein [Xylanimonas protaetiae]